MEISSSINKITNEVVLSKLTPSKPAEGSDSEEDIFKTKSKVCKTVNDGQKPSSSKQAVRELKRNQRKHAAEAKKRLRKKEEREARRGAFASSASDDDEEGSTSKGKKKKKAVSTANDLYDPETYDRKKDPKLTSLSPVVQVDPLNTTILKELKENKFLTLPSTNQKGISSWKGDSSDDDSDESVALLNKAIKK
jgi:hypothetical protein